MLRDVFEFDLACRRRQLARHQVTGQLSPGAETPGSGNVGGFNAGKRYPSQDERRHACRRVHALCEAAGSDGISISRLRKNDCQGMAANEIDCSYQTFIRKHCMT